RKNYARQFRIFVAEEAMRGEMEIAIPAEIGAGDRGTTRVEIQRLTAGAGLGERHDCFRFAARPDESREARIGKRWGRAFSPLRHQGSCDACPRLSGLPRLSTHRLGDSFEERVAQPFIFLLKN